MQNVNLNKIIIMNDASISFEFLNSYDGKYYKNIICHSVWKYSSDLCLSVGDEFPFFICDIELTKLTDYDVKSAFACLNYGFSIPESEEYSLLCILSGDVSISLICEKVEIMAIK